jgi:hypothetical protein
MPAYPAMSLQKDPLDTRTLWRMYESQELLNEGLVSFEHPLYYASDEEIEYFLGKLTKRLSRGVSSAARSVGSVGKAIGKGINAVTSVVPFSTLTSGLALTPIGMAVRTGLAAASAAASGKNVFQAAARSIASTPVTRFAVDTAAGIARGENVLKSVKQATQAGIGDFKENLRFAATVAPFVPGLGTGVAAALATANALASGERISDALIAGARNAIPGGALAQSAFDIAAKVAQGKSISEAALDAVRSRIPGGPLARAAFDASVALAKGKSLQDSLLAGGGRLLPKSPFTADITSFVKKVSSGENLGKAALSSAGNLVMKRIEQQFGPIVSKATSRVPMSVGSDVTSFASRVAAGQNVAGAALSSAGNLVTNRIEQKAGGASSRAFSRLPFNAGQFNQQLRRNPWMRELPQQELSQLSDAKNTGVWTRQGERVIVLSAFE